MNFKLMAEELVSKMTLDEKIGQLSYDAPSIEHLGICAHNQWNECLHGLARNGAATVFPQAIGLAASFNLKLMQDVAQAISDETRAKYNEMRQIGYTEIYQGLTMCAPNINIFRDPRWGRGQETYGEDPYLTGTMAVSFVRGLQGNGKYRKVDATLKHFAVHSGPEAARHGFNVEVSEHDLREIYLWAFKYCIDHADPASVMCAYNAVRKEPCSTSILLLQEILLGEWGFKGYVESDAGGISDVHNGHHVTANEIESAALALNRGCHINIGDSFKHLRVAYDQGLIDETTITHAVEKLYTARFRLGMYTDDCEYDQISYDVIECEKHTDLNRTIAQESIVLLKNDGLLPLNDNLRTIAVIGPNADDKDVLLGNYSGTPSHYTTLLHGIQEATKAKVFYARGCYISNEPLIWQEHLLREAIIVAQKSDVVVMCMGLNQSLEGEEGDGGDRNAIELPESQLQLLQAIVAVGKPIIFVNVSGSCVALGEAAKYCNAVVQCFYPGAEGGHALADILFGKVSPSGQLPVTFYRSTADLPPFEDYSMENRTHRYFHGSPLYPFGHGLSYTDYKLTTHEIEGDIIQIDVENIGNCAGQKVVQVYDDADGNRLIAFEKVLLEPGNTTSIYIQLSKEHGNLQIK